MTSTDNMTFIKNYHEYPGRDFRWGTRIQKHIQISPSFQGPNNLAYYFSINASQDRGNKRYAKFLTLKRGVLFVEIKKNIHQLLKDAYEILE